MSDKECKVDGCDRPIIARGYCKKHYDQWKKHGEVTAETGRKFIRDNDICQVDNCDKKVYAKGYCRKHYLQMYNYGKILAKGERAEKIIYKGKCKVEGCENGQISKGLCAKHYSDMKKLEELNKIKIDKDKQKTCSVRGCKNPYHAKGYCLYHYNQYYHYGKITNPNVKRNGKSVNKICKVIGCNGRHYAKGYCGYHYKQYQTYGKIIHEDRVRSLENHDNKKCLVDGCENPIKAKGYCSYHYKQFHKYGRTFTKDEMQEKIEENRHKNRKSNKADELKICSIPDCGEKHYAKGYCDKHYYKFKRFGDALYVNDKTKESDRLCSVEGCNFVHKAKGYCDRHYAQFKKHGKILDNKEKSFNKEVKYCSVDGCNKQIYAKGMCKSHYRQGLNERKKDGSMNIVSEDIIDKSDKMIVNDTEKVLYNCDKCGKESESISVMDFKPFYDAEETISINLCHKCSNELIKWMIKRS